MLLLKRTDMKPLVDRYVKKGTIKLSSSRQCTIPDYAMNSLTEEGQKLLEDSERRYQNRDFKAHFDHWSTRNVQSGPCPPADEDDNGNYCLNSFDNIIIRVRGSHTSKPWINTSYIVMFSPEKKWAVTQSGSLYSLDPKGEYVDEWKYTSDISNGKIPLCNWVPTQSSSEEPDSSEPVRVGTAFGPNGSQPLFSIGNKIYIPTIAPIAE